MSIRPPADDRLELRASFETTTNSFIVIIRSEPRNIAGQMVEWHGSVEHAQSGERNYYIEYAEYARLTEFIAARSETPLPPPRRTHLSRVW